MNTPNFRDVAAPLRCISSVYLTVCPHRGRGGCVIRPMQICPKLDHHLMFTSNSVITGHCIMFSLLVPEKKLRYRQEHSASVVLSWCN